MIIRNFTGYTGVNTKAKLKRDANDMLEDSLQGYASSECIIVPNGDFDKQYCTEVIFFQRFDADGEKYKVIGRISEIERGNYILYDNQTWLITSKPEDNGTYRKAEATLCPVELPVKESDIVKVIGLDQFGRPIKETVNGEIKFLPCVPLFSDSLSKPVETNNPLNLLSTQILITIPYRESQSIKHDEFFTLYNEVYRIIRIDPSKSINGIGILKFVGERLSKEDM